MALVIDTGRLAARDRIEAVNAALSITEVPHVLTHAGADDEVHHRLTACPLGTRSQVTELSGTAMRLTRGPRQLKFTAPERVALGFQLNRPGSRMHLGLQESLAVGDLCITDLTSCHTYGWTAGGGSRGFVFDYEMLELSVDVVRSAIPTLKQSPLYTLLQGHLAQLGRLPDEAAVGPAGAMLATSTIGLLRALLVTAAGSDSRQQREALDTTLLPRLKQYVERHLTEPALNVESIAAAHHVSVRRVYQVWMGEDLSLSQWIIRARLEGTRRELARAGSTPGIARVAERWGFSDAAHFSRRFRAAYGMTPREWCQLSAQASSELA